MRTYHDIINYLKDLFESDEFVNTVTSDGYVDMDTMRKNIYPIVDIYVVDMPLNTDSTAISQYNVDITVLDVRDFNKESVNDKFYYNDNRHDNWNLTSAILKRAFVKASKNKDDSFITLESATAAERISLGSTNALDGWRSVWTLTVDDLYTSSC